MHSANEDAVILVCYSLQS